MQFGSRRPLVSSLRPLTHLAHGWIRKTIRSATTYHIIARRPRFRHSTHCYVNTEHFLHPYIETQCTRHARWWRRYLLFASEWRSSARRLPRLRTTTSSATSSGRISPPPEARWSAVAATLGPDLRPTWRRCSAGFERRHASFYLIPNTTTYNLIFSGPTIASTHQYFPSSASIAVVTNVSIRVYWLPRANSLCFITLTAVNGNDRRRATIACYHCYCSSIKSLLVFICAQRCSFTNSWKLRDSIKIFQMHIYNYRSKLDTFHTKIDVSQTSLNNYENVVRQSIFGLVGKHPIQTRNAVEELWLAFSNSLNSYEYRSLKVTKAAAHTWKFLPRTSSR